MPDLTVQTIDPSGGVIPAYAALTAGTVYDIANNGQVVLLLKAASSAVVGVSTNELEVMPLTVDATARAFGPFDVARHGTTLQLQSIAGAPEAIALSLRKVSLYPVPGGGAGLSDADRAKLDSIPVVVANPEGAPTRTLTKLLLGALVYKLGVAWDDITGVPARVGTFTSAMQTKLAGIATGAEANRAVASKAEAEAGTDNTKDMTPLRTAQAAAVESEKTRIVEWLAQPGVQTLDGYDLVASIQGNNPQGDALLSEDTDNVPFFAITRVDADGVNRAGVLTGWAAGDEFVVHNRDTDGYLFGTITGVTYQAADGTETADVASAYTFVFAYTLDTARGLDAYGDLGQSTNVSIHYLRRGMTRDMSNADALATAGVNRIANSFARRTLSNLGTITTGAAQKIRDAVRGVVDQAFRAAVQSPSDPYTFQSDYTRKASATAKGQLSFTQAPVLDGGQVQLIIGFTDTDKTPAVARWLTHNEFVWQGGRYRIEGSATLFDASTNRYQAAVVLIEGTVGAIDASDAPVLEPDNPHRNEFAPVAFTGRPAYPFRQATRTNQTVKNWFVNAATWSALPDDATFMVVFVSTGDNSKQWPSPPFRKSDVSSTVRWVCPVDNYTNGRRIDAFLENGALQLQPSTPTPSTNRIELWRLR